MIFKNFELNSCRCTSRWLVLYFSDYDEEKFELVKYFKLVDIRSALDPSVPFTVSASFSLPVRSLHLSFNVAFHFVMNI